MGFTPACPSRKNPGIAPGLANRGEETIQRASEAANRRLALLPPRSHPDVQPSGLNPLPDLLRSSASERPAESRRTRDAPTTGLLLGRSLRLRRRCLGLRRSGFLHRRLCRGRCCFRSRLCRWLCCRLGGGLCRSLGGRCFLGRGFCRRLGRRLLRRCCLRCGLCRCLGGRCLLHCGLRHSLGRCRLLGRCCFRCGLCRRLRRRCFLHCCCGLRRDCFCGCFLCRCFGCRRFR